MKSKKCRWQGLQVAVVVAKGSEPTVTKAEAELKSSISMIVMAARTMIALIVQPALAEVRAEEVAIVLPATVAAVGHGLAIELVGVEL